MDKLFATDVVMALNFHPDCKSVAGYMISLGKDGDRGVDTDPGSFAFAAKVACQMEYRAQAAPLQIADALKAFASLAPEVQAKMAEELDSYLNSFDDHNLAHRSWSRLINDAGADVERMVKGRLPYTMWDDVSRAIAAGMLAEAEADPVKIPDWWLKVPA